MFTLQFAIQFLLSVIGGACLVIALNIACMRIFAGKFSEEVISPVLYKQRSGYVRMVGLVFGAAGIAILFIAWNIS